MSVNIDTIVAQVNVNSLGILDTSAAFHVLLAATSSTALTADRTITIDVKNAARAFNLQGDLTVSAAATISGTNTGDLTLGSFGASPNANGLSISSQVLNLQPADGSNPGGVSTTSQTFAGAKTFSSALTVSAATQNTIFMYRDTNAGDSTNTVQFVFGNSGAAQGTGVIGYHNGGATAHPSTFLRHSPRNNANSSNTDAVLFTLFKSDGSNGGEIEIQTATTGGTLTDVIYCDNQQQVTLGTGTSGTHRLNTALGTNGAGVLTTLNGPSGTSGNPTGYIQMNINGTNRFIPFW